MFKLSISLKSTSIYIIRIDIIKKSKDQGNIVVLCDLT